MQPPLRIALTPAERDELDRRLRATPTPHAIHARVRTIAVVAAGATVPTAADALGHHHQTVRKVAKRYLAEGFAGRADRPRSGRPARLTEADLLALEAQLDADATSGSRTWTVGQAAGWWAERRAVTVSPACLGEVLRRRDCRWKRTKRSTAHEHGDGLRQAAAAADLALWRFGRSS